MKLKLLKKHEEGLDVIIFKSKLFQFRWFTDCGYWFIYIHIGKRYYRFSNAGFLSGKFKN
jgi:hypothetical protein